MTIEYFHFHLFKVNNNAPKQIINYIKNINVFHSKIDYFLCMTWSLF